jgi:eukaryotic-like serine/threonine-protein kinase
MPEPGTFVTPTVRLESELGQGGMGSVWLAEHTTLHTKVVVKFIAQAISKDHLTVSRFSREAAAAAAVKSPHVVQVHDHGVSPDGTPFIVMERLVGKDLAAVLDERKKLPPAEVIAVVTQVCKALSRAHEAGVVHRDIKPQNLFLCDDADGEVFVKLLDFGIAKKEDGLSVTTTGAILGSPYYMSPEQVVGDKTIDQHSDLWSLGVVAYEALLGVRPFQGTTVGGLALAICSAPLPLPSAVDPSYGPAFDAWFAKACARDPKDRFGSAKQMADALHTALGNAEMSLAATQSAIPSAPLSPLAIAATTAAPVSRSSTSSERPRRRIPRMVLLFIIIAFYGIHRLTAARDDDHSASHGVSVSIDGKGVDLHAAHDLSVSIGSASESPSSDHAQASPPPSFPPTAPTAAASALSIPSASSRPLSPPRAVAPPRVPPKPTVAPSASPAAPHALPAIE